MPNLFIIGNGFDLAHGMKSSYNNFKEYLQTYYGFNKVDKLFVPTLFSNNKNCADIDAAKMLVKLINIVEKGNCWSDLENSLGHIDYSLFFTSNNMPEHDKIIANSIEISIVKIKKFFEKWVVGLDTNGIKQINSFANFINKEEDYFFTFNYTSILEEVYGIKKVCHVHGNNSKNIIFGHGVDHPLFLIRNNTYNSTKLFNMSESVIDVPLNRKLTIQILNRNIDNLLNELNCGMFFNREVLQCIKPLISKATNRYFRDIEKEKKIYETIHNMYIELYNDRIKDVDNYIQRIHTTLRKDSNKGLLNVEKFVEKESNFRVDNIYSIGFSYSDVDFMIIKYFRKFGASSWYIDNYSKKKAEEYKDKIKHFAKKITTFDFRKCE